MYSLQQVKKLIRLLFSVSYFDKTMRLTISQLTCLLLLSSIASAEEDENLNNLLNKLNKINKLDISHFTHNFVGPLTIQTNYTLYLEDDVFIKHDNFSIKSFSLSDDIYIISFNKMHFTSKGRYMLGEKTIHGHDGIMNAGMECEINISPLLETSINVTTDNKSTTVVLDRNKFRLRLEFEFLSSCPSLMKKLTLQYLISDLNAQKDQLLTEYNADIADYFNNKFVNKAYGMSFDKFLLIVFTIYHLLFYFN